MNRFVLPPIFYRGSVKNVRGFPGKSPWYFEFSDGYSVFDWGNMPDTLERKGRAQAQFSRILFEYLTKETHIKTTFLGMAGVNLMKIKPVSVLKPKFTKGSWDYGLYQEKPCHVLLPLEVLFRFGVPKGSSFLKRATKKYCRFLGLAEVPKTGDIFDKPVIEFTSKLEDKDRFVDYKKACFMAGLNPSEFDDLLAMAKKLAISLKKFFTRAGLYLWDGKFEFAIDSMTEGKRKFVLADSIGPDELRLTLSGCQLSKENIRQFYRGSDWYLALKEAKEMAKERGVRNWQEICQKEMKKTPPSLPTKNKQVFSMIYQVLANVVALEWEKKTIFKKAWDMDRLCLLLERGERQ